MDRTLILTAASLRSFATGLVGVLLGIYLAALGWGAETLGLVVAVGLAGNAISIAWVAAAGERLGRRPVLLIVSALSAAGLAAMAVASAPTLILAAAFLGMVNGMGRDRGAAQALDQAILADRVADARRTALFVRYTLLQDIAAALGSLALGTAAWLQQAWELSGPASYRWMFALAASAAAAQLALYAALRAPAGGAAGAVPPDSETTATGVGAPGGRRAELGNGEARRAPARRDHPEPRPGPAAITPTARRRVAGLSALFALDSVGGGFLAGAILSYWFFRRFGLGPEAIGAIFFGARALNALSYLAAGALARRIGLIRTMVFTHLPSSALLLFLPVIGALWLAITVFLVRESLVQMDVPTRQSYVAAIVAPHERTFALATTSLVRYAGWTVGPGLAGLAMATLGLGAPLVAGAAFKIVYDLGLFAAFRRVRPPEERRGSDSAARTAGS